MRIIDDPEGKAAGGPTAHPVPSPGPAVAEARTAAGADPAPVRRPPGSRPPAPPSPERFVRLAVVFYGAALVVALLWRTVWYGEPLFYASPEDAARGVRWVRDGAVGLSAGVAVVLLSGELTRRTRFGEALARALARSLGPLGVGHCVVLALASGIGEEAFFRGALQPRVGLVAASLLFGLAHFVPRRELWSWSVFSLAAGFLLGGLFAATGNLLAPIVAHVVVNAVNLRLLVRDYGGGR